MSDINETSDESTMHRIVCADNLEALSRIGRTVDVAPCSPPYASQRKRHYSSIAEDDYPEFTERWMEAVSRCLKPTGSIVVVIRSHIKDGFVSEYVTETIRHLTRNCGWYRPQEVVWSKPGSLPTGRADRMRQEWEHVLWFSRHPKLAFCDPKANGQPVKQGYLELTGGFSGQGKGFRNGVGASGRVEQLPNLRHVEAGAIARSTDVLRAAPSGCNRASYNTHPAQHPTSLYRQLIRMLCPLGGTVLDPFGGSGTTMEAAFLEKRASISIDNKQEYVDIMRRRLFDLEADERRQATG